MKILLNKIASVTKNANLPNLVNVSSKIVAEAGAIIVVKVLEDKEIYNQLELPSGRMSTIHKGDIIAVALGNRSALKGFVGEVPKKLKVGDIIKVGQAIGLEGNTGFVVSGKTAYWGDAPNQIGTHLHFGVYIVKT